METVFFFKHMSRSEEAEMQDYVVKKLPALEKLISHFPADGVVFHVKGEKFKKHSAYDVEFTMKLPTGTLTSREASHLITKAVDLAKDRLTMQLRKSLLQLRRGHRSIRAKSKLRFRVASSV